MKETKTTNYKQFTIITEKGTKKGLFFRNPLQKVFFDAYYGDSRFDAYEYKERIKNPIKRFFEILKGNGNVVKNIEEWSNDDCWAGVDVNILCFPIYFEREYRKLEAHSNSKDTNIQSIISYGYESQYNACSGCCEKETTFIKLKNGKTVKIVNNYSYDYTYSSKIEEIINSEDINKTE